MASFQTVMQPDFHDRATFLVDEDPKTLEAQQELLETIMDNLKSHHGEHYDFTVEDFITLRLTGDKFRQVKNRQWPLNPGP